MVKNLIIARLNKALENIDEKIAEYMAKIDDDTSSIDQAQKSEFF